MKTKKELESPEYNDDMSELESELKKHNIPYIIKRHGLATPDVLNFSGFYPTGEWHIFVGNISIIHGLASWGGYEVLGGKYQETQRFKTVKELIDDLIK